MIAYRKQHHIHEHILIAEKALGKPLPKGSHVHHANGVSLDNSRGNLVICQDCAYHRLLHVRSAAYDACGNPNWRKCAYCYTHDDPANMAPHSISKGGMQRFYHPKCNKRGSVE